MMNFRPFCHTDVADIILSILATYQPDTYLELGTQRGHVFNRAAQHVRKCAVGVDIAGFKGVCDFGQHSISATSNERFTLYKMHDIDGCMFQHAVTYLWHCTSSVFFSECVKQLPADAQQFDVIFIDADHSYEAVLADLYGAWQLIAPTTGLILAHDTYPTNTGLVSPRYCGEAWRAVRDFKEQMGAECECVTLPGPWAGMSILRRVVPGKPIHWQITK